MLGLGAAGLGLTAGYGGLAGSTGLKGNAKYLANLISPEERRHRKLADSHFHMRRFKERNDVLDILGKFFANIDFQSISLILDENQEIGSKNVSYEDFILDIKEAIKGTQYHLKFSDRYVSILSHGEKDVVFIRSQEVITTNPYSSNHQIHLCLEGTSYVKDYCSTDEVIKFAEKDDATIILNHPFTKPVSYLRFWFPHDSEVEYLRELYQREGILVEVFNSVNQLWLSASNEKAEALAAELGKKEIIGDTDAHSTDLEKTVLQIGTAGTYIKGGEDFKSYTGKDIILWKRARLYNNKGILRNYQDLSTFLRLGAERF